MAQASAPRGAVLRVSADGDVDTLWSSTEDVPHSIAALANGAMRVYGTASGLPDASVFALLEADGRSACRLDVEEFVTRVWVLHRGSFGGWSCAATALGPIVLPGEGVGQGVRVRIRRRGRLGSHRVGC